MPPSEQQNPAFGELWSVTRFDGAELSAYAESMVFDDARRGLTTLGIVSMLMLAGAALAYALLGFDSVYVYSCSVLSALSLHVAVSSRAVRETRVMYLLGTTLLIVNGLAFVLLAHHAGRLDAALFSAVILLFLVMPLVPWGLREAVLIVGLVYTMFTFSTLSVSGRFDSDTLWMLQLAMIAGGTTTLTVVARNIIVRRDDIRARYELERAHDRMARLSLKDPLTGAWNRRFLEQNYADIRQRYRSSGATLQFALIDIDDFKNINDGCGHDYGDLVLVRLAANFLALFSGDEHLVRLGGDEFLVLSPKREANDLIERGATALRTDPQLFSGSAGSQVNVSIGLLELPPDSDMSLDEVYRRADEALYRSKSSKGTARRNYIAYASMEAGG